MAEVNSLVARTPLVVDLDGTLLKSDLLYESVFAELANRPHAVVKMIRALLQGKAVLKHQLARAHTLNVSTLPYDQDVLAYIRRQKTAGGRVYLASASSSLWVEAIAKHLGVFDGFFGSDATNNLLGERKARCLIAFFGKGCFDYIGNSRADLPVWSVSETAVAVRTRASILKQLRSFCDNVVVIETAGTPFGSWLRLIRVHQYSKNILVFAAMVTSHSITLPAVASALTAFITFSLCASAIYIVNDAVDLSPDRTHPTKRERPLANGDVPLPQAVMLSGVLLLCGLVAGSTLSLKFLGVALSYVILTLSYSFYLKRKFLLDVIVLASLYTIRVFAGAVAIGVTLSEWLLAFSMFVFLSLALVKRYTELVVRLDAGLPDPSTRNYRVGDLPIVLAMASAAGFNSITVLSLYTASEDVRKLYTYPRLLWFICPVIIYWIGRVIMLAHRRVMHDDPIVFALKDPISIAAMVLIGVIVFAAI